MQNAIILNTAYETFVVRFMFCSVFDEMLCSLTVNVFHRGFY